MRMAAVFLGCVLLAACVGTTRSLPLSAADRVSLPVSPASYESIFSFNGSDGSDPYAAMIDVNGTLYGTTASGGAIGVGTIFRITTSGTEKAIHSFKSSMDGANPYAHLTLVHGMLYGTTVYGGPSSCGTVFRVTTSGAEKVLHAFKGPNDGCNPYAALLDVGGELYGTTDADGANGVGTVFKITTSGNEKLLYAFKGGSSDGANPQAGLTNVKGTLFGTTYGGGPSGDGTVFKVTTTGTEKMLHAFKGSDGKNPSSSLLAVNDNLYGTTVSGGAKGLGTVFVVSTSGTEKVLHSFRGGTDGAGPELTGLIDVNGTLYGVTKEGGTRDNGTIFKITTSGKETVLYRFQGQSDGDGETPHGTLTNVKGALFGTTTYGGSGGAGTVYKITP
jgi:uncharacterized repeat protein (TIGR03803 family)